MTRQRCLISELLVMLHHLSTKAFVSTVNTRLRLRPWLFNAIFAGFPILYVLSTPALTVPVALAWNRIMDATQAVLQQLEDQAEIWVSGRISLVVLQELSQKLEGSETLYADIAYWEDQTRR